MNFKLLTRDQFREGVFKRDENKCVICGDLAQDAHHIIERRLFTDGGYYLENGASVCGPCHLKAESTEISCEEIRKAIGIKKFPMPEHIENDANIDKWGNYLLPNGNRTKGELFGDASVQKILKPVLHLFVDRVKYPRTYHLPWSKGVGSDDKILKDLSNFEEKEVVVTVKMDGECTTMYSNYLHARSAEYENHESRTWVKSLQSQIGQDIPKGWRICGENLYAKHSIHYRNLESYFMVFSIWNEHNACLSWKETKEWCQLLDLKTVPVLYQGIWNEKKIKNLHQETFDGDEMEGYVVRLADSFSYGAFKNSVVKCVRENHVRTFKHWKHQKTEKNLIKY